MAATIEVERSSTRTLSRLCASYSEIDGNRVRIEIPIATDTKLWRHGSFELFVLTPRNMFSLPMADFRISLTIFGVRKCKDIIDGSSCHICYSPFITGRYWDQDIWGPLMQIKRAFHHLLQDPMGGPLT